MDFRNGQYTRLEAANLYLRMFLRIFFAIGLYLLMRFVFLPNLGVLMPFILAGLIAMLLNPMMRYLQDKLHIHRKISSLILIVVVLGTFFVGMFFLIRLLVTEISGLSRYLQMKWPDILNMVDNLDTELDWLWPYLPQFVVNWIQNLGDSLKGQMQGISQEAIAATVNIGQSVIGSTGKIIIAFVTFFLALYFTLVDYHKISVKGKKRIGYRAVKAISSFSKTAFSAIAMNIRAQIYLAAICFVYMVIAFLIVGRPYAFLSAFIVSFLDVLPIIGAVAILIPWGILSMILGDISGGIFLVVIGIGFFLIRRILEPKLVGHETGLHPLVTLISLYLGLNFFGVIGALLTPTAVVILLEMHKTGVFNNIFLDIKDIFHHINFLMRRPEDYVPDKSLGQSSADNVSLDQDGSSEE